MNDASRLTEVCGRCGFIIRVGELFEDKVALVVCDSCGNKEAETYDFELEAAARKADELLLKSQEQEIGERRE